MLGTPYAGGSEETWVKENGPLDVDRGRPFTGDDHLLP